MTERANQWPTYRGIDGIERPCPARQCRKCGEDFPGFMGSLCHRCAEKDPGVQMVRRILDAADELASNCRCGDCGSCIERQEAADYGLTEGE